MTEDQAKTKWCHAARVVATIDLEPGKSIAIAGVNRGNKDQTAGACVASACMAWRWRRDVGTETGKQGYCGLAGRPE